MTFRRLDEFSRLPQITPRCEQRTFVYGLVDPRDGTVRYIGVSVSPKMRLRYHLSKPVNGNVYDWLKELERRGAGKPTIVTLAEVCRETWEHAEQSWIGFFRGAGELYNIHDGGRQKGGGGAPKFRGKPAEKRSCRKRKAKKPLRGKRRQVVAQPSGCTAGQPHDWMHIGPDRICVRCAKSNTHYTKAERRADSRPVLAG